jgi:hypothetical protein
MNLNVGQRLKKCQKEHAVYKENWLMKAKQELRASASKLRNSVVAGRPSLHYSSLKSGVLPRPSCLAACRPLAGRLRPQATGTSCSQKLAQGHSIGDSRLIAVLPGPSLRVSV